MLQARYVSSASTPRAEKGSQRQKAQTAPEALASVQPWCATSPDQTQSQPIHGLALPKPDCTKLAKALLEHARNEEAKNATTGQDVAAV